MAKIDLTWACDSSLPDHRKVGWLASALRVTETEALGVIVSLYCRVRRQAANGDLTGIAESTITKWSGHKRATLAILQQAQLIDVTSDGKTILHGWPERRYAEQDARREVEREESKKRMRVRRSAHVRPNILGTNTEQTSTCSELVRPCSPASTQFIVPSTQLVTTLSPDKPATGRSRTKKPADPRVQEVGKDYHAAHLAAVGTKPVWKGGQIGTLIKAALSADFTPDEFRTLHGPYFARTPAPSPEHFFSANNLNRLRNGAAGPPAFQDRTSAMLDRVFGANP